MFCKTCTAVATEKCGEHELLKMSELRDALRRLAARGAADMELVKQRRAEVIELFREAHGVLSAAAESVRHTIDDYEMDVQLDDSVVSELERKREAAEALPTDQLVDSYRFIDQHVADAAAALRDTTSLAEQCSALLTAYVSVSNNQDASVQTFPVNEWLHSGELFRALLAASVTVYSMMDHLTDGTHTAAAADDDCHNTAEAAQVVTAAKHTNGSGAKPAKPYTNGDVSIVFSKSSSKSPPSSNGKASAHSTVNVPDGKISTSSSATNLLGKVSDAGKSSKAAPASAKLIQSASTSKITNGAAAAQTNGRSAVTAKTTTATVSTAAKSATTAAKLTATTAKPAATVAKPTTTTTKPATGTAKPATTSTAKPAVATTAVAKPKTVPSFSTMVKSSASTRPTAAAAAETAVRPAVQRPPRGVHPFYSLRVTNGSTTTDVVIELRPDMAPVMCRNFVMLCEGGFFDNSSKICFL